jgi:hypothetical protein
MSAMRRLSAAGVLVLATVAVWPSGAAESTLMPRNSLVAPLLVSESISIEGVGCGVAASAAVTLPAGAFDVRVRRPSVGARSEDGGLTARLTNVSVQGSAVTLTAVADGDRVCDPNAEDTPPANRSWYADFDVEVRFTQRVGVVHFNRAGPGGKTFKVRPREVRIGIAGAARGVRWKTFGGRKAVGFGTFKSLVPCAGGCSDNGTRLRVELTRPGRCPGLRLPGHKEDAVFYVKVAFVLRERLGVLRPGREWISTKLECPPPAPPPPILIR